MGSSLEDLKKFPDDVREEMGHGLYLAQMSGRHHHAKTLSGFGNAKVIEIREKDRSGTYRVMYTVEMEDDVFVLHAFQKKSKSGIETPKYEIDLVKRRLKDAQALCKQRKEGKGS